MRLVASSMSARASFNITYIRGNISQEYQNRSRSLVLHSSSTSTFSPEIKKNTMMIFGLEKKHQILTYSAIIYMIIYGVIQPDMIVSNYI